MTIMKRFFNTVHGMLPVLKLVSSTWVQNSVSNEDNDVYVVPKKNGLDVLGIDGGIGGQLVR